MRGKKEGKVRREGKKGEKEKKGRKGRRKRLSIFHLSICLLSVMREK